jgi:MYXO-CTERM domain-containing protein
VKSRPIFVAALAAAASLALAQTASAQSVGPDGFNHIMTDDGDPTLFGFVDISATGTLIASGDEDTGLVTFPAGNTFNFYGAQRVELTASTNGFLSTNAATGADFQVACPTPTVGGASDGDRLLVHHDDLIASVYYQYFPAQAASVIQWTGGYYTPGGPVGSISFQIHIYHALDLALIHFNTVSEGGLNAAIGAQDASGTTGVDFSCGTTSVAAGSVVSFGTMALGEIRVDQAGNDNDEYFEIAAIPGFALGTFSYLVIGDGGAIEEVSNLVGEAVGGLNTRFVGAESTFSLGTADATYTLNFENDDTVTHLLVRNFTGADGQDLDTNDDGLLDLLPWGQVVDVVSIIDDASTDFPYATFQQVGPDPASMSGTPFHVQRCPDLFGPWVIADPVVGAGDTPATTLNACPVCGDGATTYPETCDDSGESAACDADCTDATCGDGTLNATAGEGCDDGDLLNTDDCPDDAANGGTCQPAACGDGFIDGEGAATEACDDGGESATCDDDCTAASCGDSNINLTAGETCDDGGETVACDLDCTAASCGDMTVNNTAGETCDDGMRTATCDDDCTAVTCGDGHVNAADGEMCDGDGLGLGGETATCDLDCTSAMCGDGVVNATANEDCDDSGESATCDDDCTDASCGDNTVNATAGEQCDDGNTSNGDGCDSTCMDEGMGGAGGGGEGGMGGSSSGGMGGSSSGGMGGSSSGGMGGSGNSGTGASDNDDDDEETEDGGCSCSTPGGQGAPVAPWAALLLGLGIFARRRRAR